MGKPKQFNLLMVRDDGSRVMRLSIPGWVVGAVVGGLVMGIAEVMVTGYLSPSYRDAIAFILLIVILLVRPAGIFGKAVAEKV